LFETNLLYNNNKLKKLDKSNGPKVFNNFTFINRVLTTNIFIQVNICPNEIFVLKNLNFKFYEKVVRHPLNCF